MSGRGLHREANTADEMPASALAPAELAPGSTRVRPDDPSFRGLNNQAVMSVPARYLSAGDAVGGPALLWIADDEC
ncbi:hypothetical protein GCM10022221_46500 [Actinocorallia aurea]